MATGIPLIDGPLWLLGLELGDGPALWDRGVRSSGLQFAFTLDDPDSWFNRHRGEPLFDLREAYGPLGPCLGCSGGKATMKNRYGEPMCQRCLDQ